MDSLKNDSVILEELLKESRKARREDLAFGDAMMRLVKNPDFQVYIQRVVNPRVMAHVEMVSEPSGGMDGMVRSEFLKGALYAFCLCRDLPQSIIQAMSEVRSTQENE